MRGEPGQPNAAGEITRLLSRLEAPGAESSAVLDELMPLVYGELKGLARSNRYRWEGRAAPGTTSLVHEAYTKLVRQESARLASRGQFFSVASRVMRSILIDNARLHGRQKRGSGVREVPAEEAILVSADRSAELLALDEALDRLQRGQPDLARVVECRVFGGLTIDETAEALDVSPATVKRRWALATSWLYRELEGGGVGGASDLIGGPAL
jgi:RNA polymerase sigma factor (TIGR02999 family)